MPEQTRGLANKSPIKSSPNKARPNAALGGYQKPVGLKEPTTAVPSTKPVDVGSPVK